MNTELLSQHPHIALSPGDRIAATLTSIVNREAVLDIAGHKYAGLLPLEELPAGVEPGAQLTCAVVETDDELGQTILSRRPIELEGAWEGAEEAHRSGEILRGRIERTNKGGALLYLGALEVFIPRRHLAEGRDDHEKRIGDEIEFVIIEANRERGNATGSEREVVLRRRRAAREELFASLSEGELREVEVSGLKEGLGAFVELGHGLRGLIHRSQIPAGRKLSVGERVEAEVISKDEERGRVGLSLRRVEAARAWAALEIERGEIVSGTVRALREGLGAFVELRDHPEIRGLWHESAWMGESPQVGSGVRLRVRSVDRRRQRISLEHPRAKRQDRRRKRRARLGGNG